MASKHPIEFILDMANLLDNQAWLDLANRIVSQAATEKGLEPDEVNTLAEVLIMKRARYIAEEAAKKNPDMQAHLRKLQKAAELVDDPASDQMIKEIKGILNPKTKENEDD